MNRWLSIVLNLLAFDALWTLAVFGAGRPWWWVAPMLIFASVALQLRSSPRPFREIGVILIGAMVGVALDACAIGLGVFSYRSDSRVEFALVFLALWVNFGSTLRISLSWLWRRPWLAALLGALGGPFAYGLAHRVGAVEFVRMDVGLCWVAAQYAAVLPVWMLVADRALSAPVAKGRRMSEREEPR